MVNCWALLPIKIEIVDQPKSLSSFALHKKLNLQHTNETYELLLLLLFLLLLLLLLLLHAV